MAAAVVGALLDDCVLQEDVIEQLRADPSLDREVFEACVRFARAVVPPARSLNTTVWRVVRSPGADQHAYEGALRQAQALCRRYPNRAAFLTTRGVAEYRVESFQAALRSLQSRDELRPSSPAQVATVAMALHQLGTSAEAQAALERLQSLMRKSRYTNDIEAQAFLREAEQLIGNLETAAGASE